MRSGAQRRFAEETVAARRRVRWVFRGLVAAWLGGVGCLVWWDWREARRDVERLADAVAGAHARAAGATDGAWRDVAPGVRRRAWPWAGGSVVPAELDAWERAAWPRPDGTGGAAEIVEDDGGAAAWRRLQRSDGPGGADALVASVAVDLGPLRADAGRVFRGRLVYHGLAALAGLLAIAWARQRFTAFWIERERTVEALRDSEARWQFALEGAGDGLWDWDLRTNRVHFSRQWKAMLGYREDEIGDSLGEWESRVHPDDRGRAADLLQRYLSGVHPVYASEHRVRARDGSYRWILDRGKVIQRGPLGEPWRMIGTHADLTVHKRGEEQLAASEERYRRLVEETPEAIYIHQDGRCMFANPAGARLLGYGDPGELHGRPVLDAVHPEFRAVARERMTRVIRDRVTAPILEEKFLRLDGSPVDVAVAAVPMEWQGRPAVQVFVRDITPQKRAEAVLRETAERLEAAQRIARLGSFHCDLASGRWTPSKVLAEILGLADAAAAATVTDWLALVHPADRDALRRCFDAAATEPCDGFNREYRVVRPADGAVRWMHGTGETTSDAAGGRRLVGTMQDVTERRAMEDALRESEDKFSKAFRHAPVLIAITERSTGICLDINDAAVRVSGYAREELVGHKLYEVGGLDVAQREAFIDAVAARGRVQGVEMELRCRDGRKMTGLVSGESITFGGRPCLITIATDITERRAAEQALRVSEERFAVAVRGTNDGIWDWDIVNGSDYLSPRWKELLGYRDDELPNRSETLLQLVHPDDAGRVRDALTAHLARRQPYDVEFRMRFKGGGYRWFRSRGQAVWDAEGRAVRMAGAISDVSEQRRAEESLRESLREKEALLKEVHHRVKNNLQVISSLLRLEAAQTESPPTAAVLGEMQNRIRSMALLHETIHRSGSLARVEMPAYLQTLVHRLVHSYGESRAARVTLRFAVGPLVLDPGEAVPCGLIANELVSNCMKHAFPGDRRGAIDLALTGPDADGAWTLAVADDGVGLPATFDPRALRTLGLQLVGDLAGQLRGRLEWPAPPAARFAVVFQPRHHASDESREPGPPPRR